MTSPISRRSSRSEREAKIVALESVYSMDGDIAPIAEICDVAEKYGALTISTKCTRSADGPRGRGVAERDGVMDRSTSSKARSPRGSASWAATSPAPRPLRCHPLVCAPASSSRPRSPPALAAGALASSSSEGEPFERAAPPGPGAKTARRAGRSGHSKNRRTQATSCR